jgi:ribosome maturation factor RimP
VPGQPQRESGSSPLEPVVADAVASAGFDLEEFAVSTAGRRRVIKVIIDSADAAGVDLDQVAVASRAVSAALDEHDAALGGPYTLEVTSPGLDRPLTKPKHWQRAKLRLVAVKQADGNRFTGRVGTADEAGVELLVDGELRHLPFTEVAHAVVEVEFKPPPVEDLRLLESRESR